MIRLFRGSSVAALMGALSISFVGSTSAQIPEETAALAAAQAWVKAVTTRDVDAQMKLLPPTMFAKNAERDRAKQMLLHDNERALIKNAKFAMFGLGPPMPSIKVGKALVVVIPYKAVVDSSDGKIQTDSSLIAVALDGGSNWNVFDGSGHGARSLKTIIPGYTTGLNVPVVRSMVLKTE